MYFQQNPRLNILLPDFPKPFEDLPVNVREQILADWAGIRAQIPDRIKEFEQEIQTLLDRIYSEDDWDRVTEYFDEISDYASRINELNLWSRVDPDLHTRIRENAVSSTSPL